MKRLLFLVVSFTIILTTSSAVTRNPKHARQLADDIAARHNATVGTQVALKPVTFGNGHSVSSDGDQMYYVFNNANQKGFTIVAGSDRMPEIVGYTTTGSFDEDNLPPALREFLQGYTATAQLVEMGDVASVSIAENSRMAKKNVLSRSSSTAVEPLCKTSWGQGYPYNMLCPEYAAGQRSAVGCVATAMAQVLAYHRYPESLRASIKAYTTTSYGIQVPYVEKGVVYDWENMLDEYISGSYNSTQANAVATLMSNCGASVCMDYGDESGSFILVAAKSYARKFGMDKDLIAYVSRSDYTYEEWTALIDRELSARRPILYRGTGTAGGHAFVCDGSDGNGYYHINWGWDGSCNGYFDITVLNPYNRTLGGVPTYAFGSNSQMAIGITPDNGKTDKPLVSKKLELGADPVVNITDSVRNDASGVFKGTVTPTLANLDIIDLTRDVALAIKNADGTYQIISDKKTVVVTEFEDNGYYYYQKPLLTFSYAIPAGTDRIYVVQSTDGGATWENSNGDSAYPILITTTDTQLKQAMPESLHLRGKISATAMKQNLDATITATITNDSQSEYNNSIYIMKADTDVMPKSAYFTQNLCLRAGETKTIELTCKPGNEKSVTIWLVDYLGTVIDEIQIPVEVSDAPVLELIAMDVVNGNGTGGGYVGSQKLTMPVVYDGVAQFRFTIRNTGGDANVYIVPATGKNTFAGYYYKRDQQSYFIPGNADTDIVFPVKGELGNAMCCRIMVMDDYKFTSLSRDYTIYGKTRTMKYTNTLFAYYADSSTGIVDINVPESSCQSSFSLSGQQVQSGYKGIVIKNGRKMILK